MTNFKRLLIFKIPEPKKFMEHSAAQLGYIIANMRPADGDEKVVDHRGELVVQEDGYQVWLADIIISDGET